MNKQKLMSALQAELNRQFEYGAIMYHPDMGGQPMISYPIVYPVPRPVIDLERLADAVLGALALAHATTKTAYAHEYGKSNGDGTFSVVIDRGEPKRPVSDWPITPLYLAPAQAVPGDMVLVPLDATEAMIQEALKVDWSNEDEVGTAHNVWHGMLAAALAPAQSVPDIVEAAQRIFEAMCGRPVDWAKHAADTSEDNLFHSADWERCLTYAKAALAGHTPAEAARHVAWLIERKDASLFQKPHWYTENPDGWHSWRTDAATAKRFASKAEAEAFSAYRMIASDPTISITEHVFLASPPAPDKCAVTEAMVEIAAKAMDDAEFGFTLNLTRLVDGVSTYTLTYSDGSPPLEFGATDGAYEHVAQRKRLTQARAALTAALGTGSGADHG
ncbi:hypothetical protein [Mesorhizobium sp.]|uniref:hypothetical protein n=1 Tax=Mesorhizobium sp. TaxID=1871066 RepID=UPI00121B76B2|nr:hypothetical protein [Mesorhizobium sp.]TIM07563.1 MAG: hypothetical protein E5Y62_18530 [Mesorhizobium sp.]